MWKLKTPAFNSCDIHSSLHSTFLLTHFNSQGNKRSAGFTIEERESFEKNFLSEGFVDTFRKQHPDAVGYTYWGYRHGGRKLNRGIKL